MGIEGTSFDFDWPARFLQIAANSLIARIESDNKLNIDTIDILTENAKKIIGMNNQLLAAKVVDIQDQTREAFQSLKKCETDFNEILRTVQKTQSLIGITTKMVGLASAIISLDASKIISNIEEIIKDVNFART